LGGTLVLLELISPINNPKGLAEAVEMILVRTRSGVVLLVFSLILFSGCAQVHQAHLDLQLDHEHADSATAPGAGGDVTQDWAKQRLAKSPRHQEWVKVKYKAAGGNKEREVSAFVVYPEVKSKVTAVVVIHEIFGMSDWIQSLTDELAEAGYLAIAPDLLSGMGPNGGGTSDVATVSSTAIGVAIRDLPPDQITADLNAIAEYVAKLPAANGKVASAGFCWGGGQAFRYATNNPGLKAAFVFYGASPLTGQPPAIPVDKVALARITAPVYGFYAGNDERINATIPATIEAMKQLNKEYDQVIYEGAGHGFMRAGDAPEPAAPAPKGRADADKPAMDTNQNAASSYQANKKARDAAWVRWKSLLEKI
jgi:carboxymethylenebutenolidase